MGIASLPGAPIPKLSVCPGVDWFGRSGAGGSGGVVTALDEVAGEVGEPRMAASKALRGSLSMPSTQGL